MDHAHCTTDGATPESRLWTDQLKRAFRPLKDGETNGLPRLQQCLFAALNTPLALTTHIRFRPSFQAGRAMTRRKKPSVSHFRPRLEILETRELLAAGFEGFAPPRGKRLKSNPQRYCFRSVRSSQRHTVIPIS